MFQDSIKDNIFKSFGFENERDFVERGMSTTDAIRKGIVEFDDEIEKAVYADTAENRKLGRVGMEYHKGRKKTKMDEPEGGKEKLPTTKAGWGKRRDKLFGQLQEMRSQGKGMSDPEYKDLNLKYIEAHDNFAHFKPSHKIENPEGAKKLKKVLDTAWDDTYGDEFTEEDNEKFVDSVRKVVKENNISKKDFDKVFADGNYAEEIPDFSWDDVNPEYDPDSLRERGEDMLDKIDENPEKYRKALYRAFGPDFKEQIEEDEMDLRETAGDYFNDLWEKDPKKMAKILKRLDN